MIHSVRLSPIVRYDRSINLDTCSSHFFIIRATPLTAIPFTPELYGYIWTPPCAFDSSSWLLSTTSDEWENESP
ncbi:hypothetical protein PISMIDRAFT_688464 [Pisolithus microcarpus 441]|uniref:Uncharacterized protein n=1 Tax=Pisolithus microcarpus 441 TaxID=765257 RepID=A0A0C9YIT5_9AGAM|nr:hypothetical protein PISMIDRAFT_688464 [Pisolithus microcarpus 441]